MHSPDPPVRHVVLAGLMGSGKTTVGRLVAERLGWPMTDSDSHLEATQGRTGREIRDELGTDALHALERHHLREGLAAPGPSVISMAASVVDDEACRAALRDPSVLVAWLTVTPATAAARFDDQAHRPRYGPDPEAFLADQAAEREPRFRSVATLELPTDERRPEALADAIVAAVRAR